MQKTMMVNYNNDLQLNILLYKLHNYYVDIAQHFYLLVARQKCDGIPVIFPLNHHFDTSLLKTKQFLFDNPEKQKESLLNILGNAFQDGNIQQILQYIHCDEQKMVIQIPPTLLICIDEMNSVEHMTRMLYSVLENGNINFRILKYQNLKDILRCFILNIGLGFNENSALDILVRRITFLSNTFNELYMIQKCVKEIDYHKQDSKEIVLSTDAQFRRTKEQILSYVHKKIERNFYKLYYPVRFGNFSNSFTMNNIDSKENNSECFIISYDVFFIFELLSCRKLFLEKKLQEEQVLNAILSYLMQNVPILKLLRKLCQLYSRSLSKAIDLMVCFLLSVVRWDTFKGRKTTMLNELYQYLKRNNILTDEITSQNEFQSIIDRLTCMIHIELQDYDQLRLQRNTSPLKNETVHNQPNISFVFSDIEDNLSESYGSSKRIKQFIKFMVTYFDQIKKAATYPQSDSLSEEKDLLDNIYVNFDQIVQTDSLQQYRNRIQRQNFFSNTPQSLTSGPTKQSFQFHNYSMFDIATGQPQISNYKTRQKKKRKSKNENASSNKKRPNKAKKVNQPQQTSTRNSSNCTIESQNHQLAQNQAIQEAHSQPQLKFVEDNKSNEQFNVHFSPGQVSPHLSDELVNNLSNPINEEQFLEELLNDNTNWQDETIDQSLVQDSFQKQPGQIDEQEFQKSFEKEFDSFQLDKISSFLLDDLLQDLSNSEQYSNYHSYNMNSLTNFF